MNAKLALLVVAAAVRAAGAKAGEKEVQLKDLPPAVQAAVQLQTNGVESFRLSQEEENGKTFYEVETTKNGLSRDVLLNEVGVLVEVEEEIDPAKLPAAARKAVEGVAVGGFIKKVEAVTRDGVTEYEVSIKGGKGKSKVLVTGDGTLRPE
jgi:uncharacterized membrane protein YkoI